jgi:hypothetical protein
MQGIGSGVVIEGIQRWFYMEIQKSKRDSIIVSTTQN